MLASDLWSLARQLYDARELVARSSALFKQYPQMTIGDGYAIQREWVKLEIANGRSIRAARSA